MGDAMKDVNKASHDMSRSAAATGAAADESIIAEGKKDEAPADQTDNNQVEGSEKRIES